jgi:hypothetical protein
MKCLVSECERVGGIKDLHSVVMLYLVSALCVVREGMVQSA